MQTLSIVLPAYNEGMNLREVVEKILTHMRTLEFAFRVIIVNDGSKDSTPEIADYLAAQHDEVLTVHQENGGYGKAVRTGFTKAIAIGTEWVFFMDSDGQFDITEIDKLILKAKEGFDFIAGYRIQRADPFMRKVNGFGWTVVCNLALGMLFWDIDCAFKLFRADLIGDPATLKGEGATVNPEIILRAKERNAQFTQVGVNHFQRKHGSQTGAKLSVIIRSFRSLFEIRFANREGVQA